MKFYRNYHSSRYVGDDFVIRLRHALRAEDVATLESEFKVLCKSGGFTLRGPLDGEDDHHGLPRLVFQHTRHKFGLLHRLIRRINDFDPAPTRA